MGGDAPRRFFYGEKHWREPVLWNEKAAAAGVRRRVFCASMADWLEDREDLVPHLARLLGVIRETRWLDWQLLTKRPENWRGRLAKVKALLAGSASENDQGLWRFVDGWMHYGHVPENVWIGTTVEDQKRADERIPQLVKIPARVRFLSCEPLLEAVDLRYAAFNGADSFGALTGVDWVIAGGESGPGHRQAEVGWYEDLAGQCAAAGVPFFMKQDSGPRPGMQGRIPDELFGRKEFPQKLPCHA